MKPRTDLAIEDVDGELVILDAAAGKVHQLNASASFVWNCLGDGLAVAEIAQMLAESFNLEPDRALSDVETAISQLESLALFDE